MKNRLKEIIGILDGNGYGKDCNFLDEDKLEDGVIEFYSRDYCHNISFRELIKWYLSRLYYNDYLDDLEETQEKWYAETKYAEEQENLLMELVDIYTYYNSQDYKRYNELKDKLREIIA